MTENSRNFQTDVRCEAHYKRPTKNLKLEQKCDVQLIFNIYENIVKCRIIAINANFYQLWKSNSVH
jgi:hypothetical protein